MFGLSSGEIIVVALIVAIIFGWTWVPRIGENIGGLRKMLVENFRLIRGVLAGGVGIQRSSQHFESEGELLGAARRRALENHMLEHV